MHGHHFHSDILLGVDYAGDSITNCGENMLIMMLLLAKSHVISVHYIYFDQLYFQISP